MMISKPPKYLLPVIFSCLSISGVAFMTKKWIIEPIEIEKAQDCRDKLVAYVKCMEKHKGIRPDPYELEWCNDERDAYRESRGLDT